MCLQKRSVYIVSRNHGDGSGQADPLYNIGHDYGAHHDDAMPAEA